MPRAVGSDADAYRRAVSDPRFEQAYRAAYRGSAEPLDALWWLDRPDDPAPGGATAPAMRTAAARRALYRPDAPADALQRFRAAEELEAEVRSAALTALARADPRQRDRPSARVAELEPAPPDASTEDGSAARSRFAGRPEHLLSGTAGWPRSALLAAIPRAAVFAAETTAAVVSMFVVTDDAGFECTAASAAQFRRHGLALDVAPAVTERTGLARVRWSPSGEVTWWLREEALLAGW